MEEIFIVNITERSFFRSYKKDENDLSYKRFLLDLLTIPEGDSHSHWSRSDKIVICPKHIHKYVEMTYGEIYKN